MESTLRIDYHIGSEMKSRKCIGIIHQQCYRSGINCLQGLDPQTTEQ